MTQLLPRPLPAHLSYSQVSSLEECGERYRLERIYGLEVPSHWLAGGSAVHTATELLDLVAIDPVFLERRLTSSHQTDYSEPNAQDGQSEGTASPTVAILADDDAELIEAVTAAHSEWVEHLKDGADQAEAPTVLPAVTALWNLVFEAQVLEEERKSETPRAEWRAGGRATKRWPDKENYDWWLANGPSLVTGWLTWRDAGGWQIAVLDDGTPAVEMDVSGQIGTVEVKAHLDRVMISPEGRVALVDLKTGSREPASGEQLGTYGSLLEQRGFPRPDIGVYWMARTGQPGRYRDLTQYTNQALAWKFENALDKRNRGEFTANTNSFCSSCSVKPYCYAQDGEKADQVPRPWEADKPVIKS